MSRSKLLGAAAVLAALVAGARLLPLAHWTVQLVSLIRESGAWGVLLFVAVYAVSAVALLPGSVLTMLAGFVYGPIYGLLVVVPASLLGATCSFLLGRTILRDWVRRKMAKSPRTRALDEAVDRDAFTLVLLLRLSPLVPFNVLNYALSLSGLSLRRFVVATVLGEIPGGWLYVYLGSLVTTVAQLSTSSTPQTPLRAWFYVAGFVATLAAALVSARIAKRALAGRLPPGDEV
ncbi:MAG TPA: VTT domain-containing protein [Vicinamibacterales bacterium]